VANQSRSIATALEPAVTCTPAEGSDGLSAPWRKVDCSMVTCEEPETRTASPTESPYRPLMTMLDAPVSVKSWSGCATVKYVCAAAKVIGAEAVPEDVTFTSSS
jgi:hypothetical protein